MADSARGIAGEVEGDYGKVKVQLAGGAAGEKVQRPTKGTQVVWGGTAPGSPWAQLASLIEKSGGSASYTYLHAADLEEPIAIAAEEDAPAGEEKQEEKPAETQPAAAKAAGPVPHSTGGAEGHGDLFEKGIEFDFGGNKARVWAHPHCFHSGPRPLIVSLHGINAKARQKYPALDDKSLHMGKLAAKLVADGKTTPLLIAAPTHFSDAPWGEFDLPKFVAAVEKAVASASVEVDEDAVSVVGHSGAGGYPHKGMNKLAAEGGQFGGHKLRVFGLTDTCVTTDNAKAYADGLKDNPATAIYALHKSTGGWPSYSGSQAFARALGATEKGKVVEPAEDEADVDDAVYDNGGKTPLRVSIRIKKERLAKHHKEWKDAGAYHSEVGQHWDMVPMWFWWALPRGYPATGEDKQLGLKAHPEEQVPIDDEEKPAITGGDWAEVPPAATTWDAPAVDPVSTGAALFAPATGLYWPVRNPKNHHGRAVCFKGADGKGYGAGKSSAERHFLAGRPAGSSKPDRYHAGIDVYGDFRDIIVACEAGTVVNLYPFYPREHPLVWCLLVQHRDLVINYGEVDPASLKKYGIKKGMTVLPGQPIAEVGRMVSDSMLHFETYPPGTKQNISYKKSEGEKLLKSFFNPTAYLLALAKNGR